MAPIDARKKLDQIRRNKNKNKPTPSKVGPNVRDLRQLIARKRRSTDNDRPNSNRVASGRIIKNRPTSSGGVRDLRDTNRKLASRKNLSSSRDERFAEREVRQSTVNRRTLNSVRSTKVGKKQIPQQQYYVPPHMQHPQPPTYIIASAPAAPHSNLAMDSVASNQGASILISNLIPSITQSDIIELFGNIGVMTAVNMINQTTALVTYQNSSDAVRAIKVYHNRLLDGKPMLVNMMPGSSVTSDIRSRVGI